MNTAEMSYRELLVRMGELACPPATIAQATATLGLPSRPPVPAIAYARPARDAMDRAEDMLNGMDYRDVLELLSDAQRDELHKKWVERHESVILAAFEREQDAGEWDRVGGSLARRRRDWERHQVREMLESGKLGIPAEWLAGE